MNHRITARDNTSRVPDYEPLWTQQEAAGYLKVSARYLRSSSAPKVLLPGNGPSAKPLVRYAPEELRSWWAGNRVTRHYG